jgi:hypothetical protein
VASAWAAAAESKNALVRKIALNITKPFVD